MKGIQYETPHNTIGALIIRIGFWGPLYHNDNTEPQNSIGSYLGPYITLHRQPWSRKPKPQISRVPPLDQLLAGFLVYYMVRGMVSALRA